MSLKYIRDHYGVPAKRGGRVRYHGLNIDGTITGSKGSNLMVRLDGWPCSTILHPTWKIEYLEDQ